VPSFAPVDGASRRQPRFSLVTPYLSGSVPAAPPTAPCAPRARFRRGRASRRPSDAAVSLAVAPPEPRRDRFERR